MTIHNIEELAAYLETTPERLGDDFYDSTCCGAWIAWSSECVTVGTIVEGSDAEFTADDLRFPFPSEDFDAAIEWLEEVADEAWHEANDDPDEL